jgi:predicted amidophosphoribosyltransferase
VSVDQLECPHCRRPAAPDGRRRNGHCHGCGRELVIAAGKTEADAWRRLYGKPPPELEQRLSEF